MGTEFLLEHAESMQNMMIARATGGDAANYDYGQARAALLQSSDIAHLVPRMVKTCRSPSQFWAHINRYPTYAERREYIWSEFRPLLDKLEQVGAPSDSAIGEALERFDSAHVHAAWQKALDRRASDPEGAITMAKSLVESVCKYVVAQMEGKERADNGDDLPQLYRKASHLLNLAPDQHMEDTFKRILGGCSNIVTGLGELRNRVGDAHGQGPRPVKPSPRHAELAVNLAGTMASFLIATLEARS
ncbi:abortive infection family protein [Halomonas caseinilytica]|uniref:Abortive infection C-terminus n=1 Tax=Halomonas caseinilytica TaxID=438744 RepID=A0A1M6YBA3_9GAMM|nr:abortive infection family protein [Halomonas caseinilytica]SHL15520.1 Abortive infection C-terminus [Halomonas caseinilytica]